jgi:hypothetical protein
MMQEDRVNEAIFECIRHSQGSPLAAKKFLSDLRTDSQLTLEELDRIAQFSVPIVRQFMEQNLKSSQPA